MEDHDQPQSEPDHKAAEHHEKPMDLILKAILIKKPVKKIDFTKYAQDHGTIVSTLDRICPGMYTLSLFTNSFAVLMISRRRTTHFTHTDG